MEPLFQMSLLTDFVKLLLWTGQLLDERPASAIIVAPAGAGKTTLLENLECEQAKFLGDLTARPLHGILKNEKLTHIMLGDMLSLFGHKKSTVNLTIQNISKMTGEKIKQDPWTGEEIPPRMIGFITAVPPEDLKRRDISEQLNGGGFATRFLIVKYSYKPSTIASIHRFISENKYSEIRNVPKPFCIPNASKSKVEVSDKISEMIKDLSQTLNRDPLGFRAHRYLRALVKAQARRQMRTNATEDDFRVVSTYCDFFSSEGKAI